MVDSELRISNTSSTAEQLSIDEATPVIAVVTAVATVSGTDPTDLPPLHNVIDAEALNNLVTSDHGPGLEAVSFEYAGYNVVITGSRDVSVSSIA